MKKAEELSQVPHGTVETLKQPGATRLWLGRWLLCLGLTAGIFSMWDTLTHSWDSAFQAPALSLGPTHTNYHAFREWTLSVDLP